MFIILIAIFALSSADDVYQQPFNYGVTIGITPYSHPVISQYHSQDTYGQYTYGYVTPTQTKTETKTADGVTQGGYSYIDTKGVLQSVSYVADPIHGFRVVATNLPKDLPEVAYAKAKHLADFQAIKAEHQAAAVYAYSNPVVTPIHTVAALPVPVQDLPEVVKARNLHLAAVRAALAKHAHHAHPQVVQDLPEVIKARAEHLAIVEATKARDAAIRLSPSHLNGVIAPVSYPHSTPIVAVASQPSISYAPLGVRSQYHAQDGYGQYTYGYAGPWSSKAESRTADGVVRGGYSYIDSHGILQTVHYVADSVHGFRVAATNLP